MNRYLPEPCTVTIMSGARAFAALAVIGILVPPGGAAVAGDWSSAGWLNVKECGASGSEFETTTSTTAGSNKITVKDVGDFKVGQEVMIEGCNAHYPDALIRGPGAPYRNPKTLNDEMQIRGFDGSTGKWLVFLMAIDGTDPLTFRWSDDMGKTWPGTKVPLTQQWVDLSGGVQIRFRKTDWQSGHVIQFAARAQLVTFIEKIEGKTFWLKDVPNKTVKAAALRHCDSVVLQAIIDRAMKEKRNLFFPVGRYRLARGLVFQDASSIRVEGASGENTVMDITQGTGPVFRLTYGKEVTIRNFRMVGHGKRGDHAGPIITGTGFRFWGMALKRCQAVFIRSTERVLIENVHASQMANECFYSQGPCRTGEKTPEHYTRSLTFLRCSVTDCGFNAFNNNDIGENTSVLYCRVQDIGSYAYEGPGKFVRCIGNYVRNAAGGFVIGNYDARSEHLHKLGCGQAVIRDNVLEGTFTGRAGVAVTRGARQVTIANNLFVNFNGTAIRAADSQMHRGYPARNIVITGNIVDMTYNGEKPRQRTGIEVSSSDVSVADNQIYVRGPVDQRVWGIWIKDPAVNITVHDNLVRNCAYGIRTSRIRAKVEEVIDPATFLQKGLPMGWRTSHLYRGWGLAWVAGDKASGMSTLDSYDPESLRFKLTKAHSMKVGDQFEVFPPHSANWNIHDNTITGCAQPVVLDSYGSDTSLFRNNIVTRGQATGVKQAVVVAGRFKLIDNYISGFDEKDSTALLIKPDRFGKPCPNLYRGNIFERCSKAPAESKKGS